MAILVVLAPASDAEPSLRPAAVSELARLGVTGVDVVRDDGTVGLVIEGWAFDPGRPTQAVLAALGCDSSRARTLQPLLHVAVSPGTGEPH